MGQPVKGTEDIRSPRKVLHILNDLRFSGAETMLACSGGAFNNAGWESHILATGDSIGPFAPVLARAGYILHHIPFAKKWAFFAAIRRLVTAGGYDVVHIHTERAYLFYAMLAAPSARVVRTVHSTFHFSGGLRLRKILERQFCRWLLGVRFIAPSHSVDQNEQSRFFLKARRCPNWYDDGRYTVPTDENRAAARDSLGYGPDDIVIVSVGSYIPLKNHDSILAALSLLPDTSHFRYLHVGSQTDPQTGRSLKGEAARLGVADRVQCAGEGRDVLACLWAADIFVMPSHWEGVGIAAIEAMATGLPAILTNRPGLADFAALAPDIRYCEPDPPDIARQIAALASMTSSERQRIGREQATAMRRNFPIAGGIQAYITIYQGR